MTAGSNNDRLDWSHVSAEQQPELGLEERRPAPVAEECIEVHQRIDLQWPNDTTAEQLRRLGT